MVNNQQKSGDQHYDQAIRIQKSKIYGDGTTLIPQGIVDVLFVEKETGIITKHKGSESSEGRILVLLPFRTPRNLERFASYSQPSNWKLNFSRGMMVNAVIENGYVKKLIPSYKFMPAAEVITPEELEKPSAFSNERDNVIQQKKKSFQSQVADFESEGKVKSLIVPAGFEEVDDHPF